MIGNLFVYNSLRVLLLATLLLCGVGIYKSKNKGMTALCTFLIIVTFSLIEGLRWDRGPDYYNNYLLLTTNDIGIAKSEPIFNLIIDTFKFSSFPYWCAFVFFSFLYIYSFVKVVKEFPKTAIWALPIMYLTTVAAHENLVRQFIAISFVLFAYYFYIKHKKALMLLCLFCIFNIHLSGIFVIAIFLFFIYFNVEKRIKTPFILIGIYLLLYFFWSTDYLTPLTDFLSQINLGTDTTMQNYLDNADRWFSDEGSLSQLKGVKVKTSLLSEFLSLATDSIVIYFGFKTMQYDRRMRIPYWFTFIAMLIFILGGDIELYRRFGWWLYYFMPIVIGAIWYLVPMKKNIRITLISVVAINYIYRFYLALTTIPSAGFAFIWDR